MTEPTTAPSRASRDLPKTLQKGQQTRATILEAALSLASHMGLEGLSIGALADVTRMSKSGVFAHFGSREELQISVIREYHTKFEEEVFHPAMRVQRGRPRSARPSQSPCPRATCAPTPTRPRCCSRCTA